MLQHGTFNSWTNGGGSEKLHLLLDNKTVINPDILSVPEHGWPGLGANWRSGLPDGGTKKSWSGQVESRDKLCQEIRKL